MQPTTPTTEVASYSATTSWNTHEDPSETDPIPAGSPSCHKYPYADAYTEALCGLDNHFVHYLRAMHGVPASNNTSQTESTGNGTGRLSLNVGSSNHPEIHSGKAATSSSARPTKPLYFRNDWAAAITYRYRPTEAERAESRADPTMKDVLGKAEGWIQILYNNMMNVANCNNKPDSNELSMFKSTRLDKRAVEATCRAILVALIHRCVVGYCGPPDRNAPAREDRSLSCKERLIAVAAALRVRFPLSQDPWVMAPYLRLRSEISASVRMCCSRIARLSCLYMGRTE